MRRVRALLPASTFAVMTLAAVSSAAPPGSVLSLHVLRSVSDFLLSWTADGDVDPVTVFTGTSPDAIDQHIGNVSGASSLLVGGLNPAQRHYFRVKGGAGEGLIAAERGVPQMGVLNFREIGGYTTDANPGGQSHTVKWGLFFRSGSSNPTSNQSFLTALGVRTIIDVRAPIEVTPSAPAWAAPGVTVVLSPIFDQNAGGIPDPVTPRLCLPQNVSPNDPTHHYFPFDPVCFADQEAFFGPNGEFFTAFKSAAYRGLVSGNGPPGANFGDTVRTALRTLLLTLTDRENLPLVWADTNGSARAGWGTVVVLLALGVSDANVMADYLLTNEFRAAANNAQLNALVASGRLGKRIYLEPQLFERAEFLHGQLDELHILYGTFENYAQQALGITPAQLALIRENLLKG